MEELIARAWEGLEARVGGPMTFRLILQPAMAALLALRAGLKDAREGRPPYLWTLITDPGQRVDLLREGWRSIARVFGLAVVMDLIYEWVMGRWFYPLETLTVAIVLAVVPYLVLRGPVNRIARRWNRAPGGPAAHPAAEPQRKTNDFCTKRS
jgi:hypothetical protein